MGALLNGVLNDTNKIVILAAHCVCLFIRFSIMSRDKYCVHPTIICAINISFRIIPNKYCFEGRDTYFLTRQVKYSPFRLPNTYRFRDYDCVEEMAYTKSMKVPLLER